MSTEYVILSKDFTVVGELDRATGRKLQYELDGDFMDLTTKSGRKFKVFKVANGCTYGSTSVRVVISAGFYIAKFKDLP